MSPPGTPPHTLNVPNARSVQFTFACMAMAGEICTGGAAAFVFGAFSGVAMPTHWASAITAFTTACVLCGWARLVARAWLQRRRERRKERRGDSACDGGGCRCGSGSGSGSAHAIGVPPGLHRLRWRPLALFSLHRVSLSCCCLHTRLPGPCTRRNDAAHSFTAAVKHVPSCRGCVGGVLSGLVALMCPRLGCCSS